MLKSMVLVCLAALALSACGSSNSPGTSTTSSGGQYQARLNLAKCFRSHGINVPDPSPSGSPGQRGDVGRALSNYSQAQINSATQACKQYLAAAFPRLNLTPQQQAQFRQQFVKFAECMRSHGVNVPDPRTASGGGFGLARQFRSVDRNSPAFQAAAKACQSLRPKFGRGGPGGFGIQGGSGA
jgi:hypothetical protein